MQTVLALIIVVENKQRKDTPTSQNAFLYVLPSQPEAAPPIPLVSSTVMTGSVGQGWKVCVVDNFAPELQINGSLTEPRSIVRLLQRKSTLIRQLLGSCLIKDSIGNTFNNRCRHRSKQIGETLDDICEGRGSIDSIPTIEVANESGNWRTSDNRRLWVFRQLERLGKCDDIPVRNIWRIPPNKKTSTNDGTTIRVRGSGPGGRWYRQAEGRSFNMQPGIRRHPDDILQETSQSRDNNMKKQLRHAVHDLYSENPMVDYNVKPTTISYPIFESPRHATKEHDHGEPRQGSSQSFSSNYLGNFPNTEIRSTANTTSKFQTGYSNGIQLQPGHSLQDKRLTQNSHSNMQRMHEDFQKMFIFGSISKADKYDNSVGSIGRNTMGFSNKVLKTNENSRSAYPDNKSARQTYQECQPVRQTYQDNQPERQTYPEYIPVIKPYPDDQQVRRSNSSTVLKQATCNIKRVYAEVNKSSSEQYQNHGHRGTYSTDYGNDHVEMWQTHSTNTLTRHNAAITKKEPDFTSRAFVKHNGIRQYRGYPPKAKSSTYWDKSVFRTYSPPP